MWRIRRENFRQDENGGSNRHAEKQRPEDERANTPEARMEAVRKGWKKRRKKGGREHGKVKHFRVNFSSKRFHFTLPNFRQKKDRQYQIFTDTACPNERKVRMLSML